jgi:8-amino-7-oxononanoate synthase
MKEDLAPLEAQALKREQLRRALEERRSAQSGAAEDVPQVAPKERVPESFYKIEEFPRYLQMRLHRELAYRAGLENPFFQLHDGVGRDTTSIGGREYLNFSTYNYLGLNGDPRVNHAAQQAAEQFGTSASSSRIVGGERPPHRDLERLLADLHGVEDALAFVSGYGANMAIVSTIAGPKDAVVMDRLVHNSIVQGAKLSGAMVQTFPHNDWQALDALLKSSRHRYERVLIVAEGIYSMEGDMCPLDRLAEIKERHKALLMIDEAHSVGVLGQSGRGIREHFGVSSKAADIWMGTLSKTFAGCGGYAAGSSALIELLKFTASGFIYSVGMPPPLAAASAQALRIMLDEPDRVAKLRSNGQYFLKLAKEKGFDTGFCEGYNIIPIILGRSVLAARVSNGLVPRGIQVQPVVYPAVDEKAARLRFFLSSDHSEKQLRDTIEHLASEIALHAT